MWLTKHLIVGNNSNSCSKVGQVLSVTEDDMNGGSSIKCLCNERNLVLKHFLQYTHSNVLRLVLFFGFWLNAALKNKN